MQISAHFQDKDFLSEKTIRKIKAKGQPTTRYINPYLVRAAEGVRAFLNAHYKKVYPDLDKVIMIGNKRGVQTRGVRKSWDNSSSSQFSDHWWGFAFDCDVYLIFNDGRKVEVDYDELINLVLEFESEFMDMGITTIESAQVATTWFHFSIAWHPELTHIKIV